MTDFSPFVREQNLIGGAWVGADSGAVIDVTNPATGAVIARVPNAGADETRRAIDAAHAAFPAYAALPLNERVGMLRRLHQAIMDEPDFIAREVTIQYLEEHPDILG